MVIKPQFLDAYFVFMLKGEKMYQIKVENCNNIKVGNIGIEPMKLNIKYGINGNW